MIASQQSLNPLGRERVAPERGPIRIAALRHDLGISRERMARLLDVSAKTVQRWEEHDQLPTNRWILQVVVELQNIADLGLIVFTPEGFSLLMRQPQPVFGHKSGLQMIEEGHADDVFAELAGAYEGYLGT